MLLIISRNEDRPELESKILAAAFRQSVERGDADGSRLAHRELVGLLARKVRPGAADKKIDRIERVFASDTVPPDVQSLSADKRAAALKPPETIPESPGDLKNHVPTNSEDWVDMSPSPDGLSEIPAGKRDAAEAEVGSFYDIVLGGNNFTEVDLSSRKKASAAAVDYTEDFGVPDSMPEPAAEKTERTRADKDETLSGELFADSGEHKDESPELFEVPVSEGMEVEPTDHPAESEIADTDAVEPPAEPDAVTDQTVEPPSKSDTLQAQELDHSVDADISPTQLFGLPAIDDLAPAQSFGLQVIEDLAPDQSLEEAITQAVQDVSSELLTETNEQLPASSSQESTQLLSGGSSAEPAPEDEVKNPQEQLEISEVGTADAEESLSDTALELLSALAHAHREGLVPGQPERKSADGTPDGQESGPVSTGLIPETQDGERTDSSADRKALISNSWAQVGIEPAVTEAAVRAQEQDNASASVEENVENEPATASGYVEYNQTDYSQDSPPEIYAQIDFGDSGDYPNPGPVPAKAAGSTSSSFFQRPPIFDSDTPTYYQRIDADPVYSFLKVHKCYLRVVRRLLVRQFLSEKGQSLNSHEFKRQLKHVSIAFNILSDSRTRLDYDLRQMGLREPDSGNGLQIPQDAKLPEAGGKVKLSLRELLILCRVFDSGQMLAIVNAARLLSEERFWLYLAESGFLTELELDSIKTGFQYICNGLVSICQFEQAFQIVRSSKEQLLEILLSKGWINIDDLQEFMESAVPEAPLIVERIPVSRQAPAQIAPAPADCPSPSVENGLTPPVVPVVPETQDATEAQEQTADPAAEPFGVSALDFATLAMAAESKLEQFGTDTIDTESASHVHDVPSGLGEALSEARSWSGDGQTAHMQDVPPSLAASLSAAQELQEEAFPPATQTPEQMDSDTEESLLDVDRLMEGLLNEINASISNMDAAAADKKDEPEKERL